MAIPIISQIANFARNIVNGSAFKSTENKINIWGMSTTQVFSTIDQQNAIEKGFNENTAVYSIIKRDAKKFGGIEKYLENKATDEPFDDTHPLMILLNRPNQYQSQDAFLTIVRAYYKICGEAFIWLNRGDVTQLVDPQGQLVDRTPEEYSTMPVIEMFVLPSNKIIILPDPTDPYGILGYRLQDKQDINFRKEDIIHWKDINLDWQLSSKPHLRGMTALRPGSKTLDADVAAVESMVAMFQNQGARGAIASGETGRALTPRQQTQIDDVINDKLNNRQRKGAIAALEGPWTYLDMGLTAVDMETLKGREFIYKELCFLFGVPYELFDSQVTYANKAEAQKGWVINEIVPDSKQFDGELNRQLLPAFKLTQATAEICSNFDDLPELQEDKAKQIEWMMKGPYTMNEIREATGFEENPDPAMDEIFIPTTLTPITGEAGQNAQMIRDIQNMQNDGGANSGNGKGNNA